MSSKLNKCVSILKCDGYPMKNYSESLTHVPCWLTQFVTSLLINSYPAYYSFPLKVFMFFLKNRCFSELNKFIVVNIVFIFKTVVYQSIIRLAIMAFSSLFTERLRSGRFLPGLILNKTLPFCTKFLASTASVFFFHKNGLV